MAKLKNINFMSKERFDSLAEVSDDELYAVRSQVVVDTYSDEDGNWYRVYSDGWVEQGGQNSISTSTTVTTFLKPFADTNYSLSIINKSAGYSFYTAKTTTSFTADTSSKATVDWFACGQGA